jgi:hypothetical protein
MASAKQQENMLLTEHFTWPPIVRPCRPATCFSHVHGPAKHNRTTSRKALNTNLT